MVNALRKGWNRCDDFEFIDLEKGVFLVQFKSEVDSRRVKDKSPWCFNGFLVALWRWEPDIAPSGLTFKGLPLWLHIKGLPFEWNIEQVLSKLGEWVGKVLKVEQ